MVVRPLITFIFIFGIASTRQAAAQESFGEILLQAFTTGLAPSSNVGPNPVAASPSATPSELLPEVTLFPSPNSNDTPENESESLEPTNTPENATESSEPTSEVGEETEEFESPSPSAEVEFEKEDLQVMPSATPTPESTPAEILDSLAEESPFPTAYVTFEDGTVFKPIRVNCGSFDERSTFREDADKWYNTDSLTAEDPLALARFGSLSEGVLYATYRYAEETLTYRIPLSTTGLFELTLHWAEISPFFMRSGARVFKVVVNGEEVDSEIDVYRESSFGSFSPLSRRYIVDTLQKTITIELIKVVGQPMLSAFQILRPDAAVQEIDF